MVTKANYRLESKANTATASFRSTGLSSDVCDATNRFLRILRCDEPFLADSAKGNRRVGKPMGTPLPRQRRSREGGWNRTRESSGIDLKMGRWLAAGGSPVPREGSSAIFVRESVA